MDKLYIFKGSKLSKLLQTLIQRVVVGLPKSRDLWRDEHPFYYTIDLLEWQGNSSSTEDIADDTFGKAHYHYEVSNVVRFDIKLGTGSPPPPPKYQGSLGHFVGKQCKMPQTSILCPYCKKVGVQLY